MNKFKTLLNNHLIEVLKTYVRENGEVNIEDFHHMNMFCLSHIEYDEDEKMAYPLRVCENGLLCTRHEREAFGDEQDTFVVEFERVVNDYLLDIVEFIADETLAA